MFSRPKLSSDWSAFSFGNDSGFSPRGTSIALSDCMARIIEFTIIAVLLVSWQAFGGELLSKKNGQFVKCKTSDCRYKVKVDGVVYTFVSSTSEDLNQEVYSILDELEKEKAAASDTFCVTGKKIIMKSKKISDGKLFKFSSIGPVKLKSKTTIPHRSNEAEMDQSCGL